MNDPGNIRLVDENSDVSFSAAKHRALASLNLIEDAMAARDQADAANKRLQQEIAEHKVSEEALQASEEQHRLLLQFLPVGVVVHAPDTSILLANHEAELLLGLSMEVMQGKKAMDPAWRFVREDGNQMPVEEYPVSRVLATGKPLENLVLGVDRYMGSERSWILVNAFPQLDEAGQIRQVEVTFMDLTERKRLEAALAQRLVALTRPLDHPEGITFSELFDLETIQRIQDEFAAATGVASVITQPDGTPITRPSNFCRLCKDIIRGTEIGCSNCYHSDAILGRHHPDGPVVQACLSGGLLDAGASITVGNQHIANWLIGQVRDKMQSEEKMLDYARKIGADASEFLAAYREVPSMSMERFQQIAMALFTLANQLSATAYQNIQQARFINERQQAEAALNNERLQLRTLIDNLPYSIYFKDTECRFVIANKTLVRRMGVASSEVLIGHDDTKFHPAELARQYRDDELRVMREGIGFYGKEERTRIGVGEALRWSSTTKVPIKNASDQVIGLVGIGIDITERKRTESYQEMRREVIQLLNELADQQDILQRVITVLKRQTGFDAVGLRLQDGEDFPYFSQDGFPQDFLLTEGTLLIRSADGGICRDKEGNACLKCTCGLVISGKTDPTSPLFTKGGSFWTNNSLPLLALPSEQDPRCDPRNTCIHYGYVSVALIPVRDKDRIIGLIHLNDRRKDSFSLENVELLENIAAYIGEALMRRKAEKALHDLAESKAKFASTVAHELRSPLAMIKEATHLVADEVLGPLNEGQKEMLNITKNNIARLGRLVNNVLALQKIGAKKMDYDFQEHDLNDVVKEAHANAMLFAVERKADVMMDLGADIPRIKFDTDKIMQVLINLLANAIKYSESGPVVIQTRRENSEIQVSVRDSGQGVYPEEMDEIFKPFVQAKGKKKGGTGLGLAITKEIILAHHGRIWVESEVGKGSTFYFTLPV